MFLEVFISFPQQSIDCLLSDDGKDSIPNVQRLHLPLQKPTRGDEQKSDSEIQYAAESSSRLLLTEFWRFRYAALSPWRIICNFSTHHLTRLTGWVVDSRSWMICALFWCFVFSHLVVSLVSCSYRLTNSCCLNPSSLVVVTPSSWKPPISLTIVLVMGSSVVAVSLSPSDAMTLSHACIGSPFEGEPVCVSTHLLFLSILFLSKSARARAPVSCVVCTNGSWVLIAESEFFINHFNELGI